MSYRLTQSEILFRQRFLSACDLYHDNIDGIWGKNTDSADKEFDEFTERNVNNYGRFDSRSEAQIRTLILPAQVLAREFMLAANAFETVKILSGNRTYAEQDAIYAQGRTVPGIIVTKAKGGQSNHNFGIAWDIGIFRDGKYFDKDQPYIDLGYKIMPTFMDLEWGHNWHSIHDNPHYNLKTLFSDTNSIRTHFEKGEKYFI